MQKKMEEERLKNGETIRKATDSQLSKIINDCEKQIRETIYKENKIFDIYFPYYSPSDLRSLYQMSVAMRMPMGTPSVALNDYKRNFTKERIKKIRDFPDLPVQFVVESAFDWFSGPKRYAAIYDCHLEGLSISTVIKSETFHLDR